MLLMAFVKAEGQTILAHLDNFGRPEFSLRTILEVADLPKSKFEACKTVKLALFDFTYLQNCQNSTFSDSEFVKN